MPAMPPKAGVSSGYTLSPPCSLRGPIVRNELIEHGTPLRQATALVTFDLGSSERLAPWASMGPVRVRGVVLWGLLIRLR